MDIATFIGLLAGFGLVIAAIVAGGSPLMFLDLPSMVIVLGGTTASTLINYPLRDILGVFGTVKNAFITSIPDPEMLIERLVRYAAISRREGVLALEGHARQPDDDFLQKGIALAIDGAPPDLIKDILSTELTFMEDRHASGQAILYAMGTFAPAFGMIGTLIGLIEMLTSLNDPSQIGRGMATALITTFYGMMLANVVFLPAAGKLRVRTANELLAREIIIEGILSIRAGESPRLVEEKLKAFVAPSIRRRVATGLGYGAPRQ